MDQTEKASPPVTDGTEVTGADKTAGETHSGGTETAAQTPGETPVRPDDRAGTQANGTAPVSQAETGKDGETGSASQAEAENGNDPAAAAEAEQTERPALDEAQKALFESIVRENAALRAEQAENERRGRAAETALGWQREAEALKSVYPSLELKEELDSPQTGPRFIKLLLGGADVRTAYEAVHRDEILAAVMRFAAERAREMTVSDIRARGTRPAENGGDGTAPASFGRVNVHELTRGQREAIARRVLRGERVEL